MTTPTWDSTVFHVVFIVATLVTCALSCVLPGSSDDRVNMGNVRVSSSIPVTSSASCIATSAAAFCPLGTSTYSPKQSPSSTVASTTPSSRPDADHGPCAKDAPCTGDMTFYDTANSATNPSSCGTVNHGNSDDVLAIPHGIMTDEDCGKTVVIEYNGRTKTGTVVDKCMEGCDNTSIDVSRHLFESLAPLAQGRIHGVTWYIL